MIFELSQKLIDAVIVEVGALNRLAQHLSSRQNHHSRVVVISDRTTFSHYGELVFQQMETLGLPAHYILTPEDETNKTLQHVEYCWKRMLEAEMDRKSLIIALGGGHVTDLAGFVASCYMRGIDLINIPTSLTGMADAGLGGKNGVNMAGIKNLVGTFYQPSLIVIDPQCLTTLPRQHYIAGLSEVIKHGVACDADLFEFIKKNTHEILARDLVTITTMVEWSCRIKLEIVNQDEKEQGKRSVLNWGHTFAHALESLTDYTQYLHGEAVAIGMSCAAYVSKQLGFATDELVTCQDDLCRNIGLPIVLPDISIDAIIDCMMRDKKSSGENISCIVAKNIGEVFKVENVARQIVSEALLAKRQRDAQVLSAVC